MLESLTAWLETTWLSALMTNNVYVWPISETLHFMGLAMLIGAVWVLDLRMLGVAKELKIASMHRLIRWGVAGFVINAVTGVMFFVGTPYQYVGNIGFYLKMLFIALAGINVLVFYLTVNRRLDSIEAGEDAPIQAKIVAALSLFLWLGVMCFGRLLPYFGSSF
jgi:hypothetical protein